MLPMVSEPVSLLLVELVDASVQYAEDIMFTLVDGPVLATV